MPLTIRVTSNDGITRWTVDPNDKISTVQDKLDEQLKKNNPNLFIATTQLSKTKDGEKLDPSSVFASASLKRGDMLYYSYTENEKKKEQFKEIIAPPQSPPILPVFRPCKSHSSTTSCVKCVYTKWKTITRMKEATVTSASVADVPGSTFQSYVNALSFTTARVGFAFGHLDEDNTVCIEAIYEPPQQNTEDGFYLQNIAEIDAAVKIADFLGLQKVGIVVSRSFKQSKERTKQRALAKKKRIESEDVYEFSADELMAAATFHNRDTSSSPWVILSVTPTLENEKLQGSFEAFEISKEFWDLHRNKYFDYRLPAPPVHSSSKGKREVGEVDNTTVNPFASTTTAPSLNRNKLKPNHIKFKKGTKVQCAVSKVSYIDTDYFIMPIPIIQHKSPLSHNFPVENRPDRPQSKHDLLLALQERGQFEHKVANFHLLLYLFNQLGAETANGIAQAVGSQRRVEEGYKLLVESWVGLA